MKLKYLQKTLEEKAKLLEELWEIHQPEEKIRIKTDTIQKIESRIINELEQKLGKTETTQITTQEPLTKQSNNGYSLRKLFGEH